MRKAHANPSRTGESTLEHVERAADVDATAADAHAETSERAPTMLDIMARAIVAMQAQLDLAATVVQVMQLEAQAAAGRPVEVPEALRRIFETGGQPTMPPTFGSGIPAGSETDDQIARTRGE